MNFIRPLQVREKIPSQSSGFTRGLWGAVLAEPRDRKFSPQTEPSELAIPCWLFHIESRNYPLPDSYRPFAPMGHCFFRTQSPKAITFSIQLPYWVLDIDPKQSFPPDKTFFIPSRLADGISASLRHSKFLIPNSSFLIPLLFSSPCPNLIDVYFLCKMQSHETSGCYQPK